MSDFTRWQDDEADYEHRLADEEQRQEAFDAWLARMDDLARHLPLPLPAVDAGARVSEMYDPFNWLGEAA